MAEIKFVQRAEDRERAAREAAAQGEVTAADNREGGQGTAEAARFAQKDVSEKARAAAAYAASADSEAEDNTAAAGKTAERLPDTVVIPGGDEDVVDIEIPEDEEKVDNIIKLSKAYKFEGEIIRELDLTGLEDINAITMQKIEAIYRKTAKNTATIPEITLDYALCAAHVVTGKPLEFFKRISGKDAVKIKSRVVNFLYSED